MRYVIGNSENLLMNNYHRLTLVLAIALALGLAPPAFGAAVKQKTFASAEEGVKALMEAVKKNDTNAMLAILGPEAKSLIESGDQVSDRAAGERFVKSYEESNKLVKSGDTKAILEVGKDAWPFPIPLIRVGLALDFFAARLGYDGVEAMRDGPGEPGHRGTAPPLRLPRACRARRTRPVC